jgi:hypothetical protein
MASSAETVKETRALSQREESSTFWPRKVLMRRDADLGAETLLEAAAVVRAAKGRVAARAAMAAEWPRGDLAGVGADAFALLGVAVLITGA